MSSLEIGLTGQIVYRVGLRDLASAWANEFPVLATPVLLWIAELACMRAVEGRLAENEITLGLTHKSSHVGASLLNADVEVRAILTEIDHRNLEFQIEATDQGRVVLKGSHVRARVIRERFVSKISLLKESNQ